MTTITLPIDPKYFWAIVWLIAFALAVAAVYAAMPRLAAKRPDPLDRFKDVLGAAHIADGLFLPLLLLWGVLLLALFGGLMLTLWELIWSAVPQGAEAQGTARFALIRLAAMTATLGAVVALPFTLIRLRLTQRQTETAIESLFNDKINAATEDLHAMRQRWDRELEQNIWEDDITHRNAAIDRLWGLANERPDTAPRISRQLSVYVRELSREVPAEDPPDTGTPGKLGSWSWARSLTAKRSDMENAVQVLGRLKGIPGITPSSITIDLRHTNLQGFNLYMPGGLNFEGANFSGAQMQGAVLRLAQMQDTNFIAAQMQEADLSETLLQGADLDWAEMQEAILSGAQMQKASLRSAQMQRANLRSTQLQGADCSYADFQQATLSELEFDDRTLLGMADFTSSLLIDVNCTSARIQKHQINSAFAAWGTVLPGGGGPDDPNWPTHWPKQKMEFTELHDQWEIWKQDPDGYQPPDA